MLPRFDFHVHTLYSDGDATALAMVEAAEARGLAAVALTDHGPELSVGIPRERVPSMLRDARLAQEDAGIEVLVGIEANVVRGGSLDVDERLMDELDLVLAGLHTMKVTADDPSELAREYLNTVTRAIQRQRVDVLAHPFQFRSYLAPYLTREDLEGFIELIARKGIAIELNSKYRVPDRDLIQACLREGVKLSVGTDAHTTTEVGRVDWPMAMLKRVGARDEDLILRRFLG
jgi:histidinol phosphatase-like PHP family hydrolase